VPRGQPGSIPGSPGEMQSARFRHPTKGSRVSMKFRGMQGLDLTWNTREERREERRLFPNLLP